MSDIDSYKPKMETAESPEKVPVPCVATPKLDGEFQVVVYSKGEAGVLNRWGRTREVPALKDLEKSLRKRGISDALMLGELHVLDRNGRPLRLPDLLSARAKTPELLRLAIFDIVKIEGKGPPNDYIWRMEELQTWLNGSKRIYAVPYTVCEKQNEVRIIYDQYLLQGYEGIVTRTPGRIFKVKPVRSVDCVLIGINKRSSSLLDQVTSIKLAVMDEGGRFVDVGDVASGIDLQLRAYLTKLLQYKVGEDSETIYIQPYVVLEVEYQETFEAEKTVRSYVGGKYIDVAKTTYFSLRSPRLKRFRPDKKAIPSNIPTTQIS